MRPLYSLLIRLVAPVAWVALLWRGLRDRSYWQGLMERYGYGRLLGTPTLWLHAVSLGEMSAAAPLIAALRDRHPQAALVLTTATPAGRARALTLAGGALDVRYLPFDTPGAVRRFLTRTRPRCALIMETELWPNLFDACRRRGVPVLLASARLSESSVRRYRRFARLVRPMLSANVTIGAQSAEDARRFAAIGAPAERLYVVGNVKFDVTPDAQRAVNGALLRDTFGVARRIWIAGSTHAGEDEIVLRAHARLRQSVPDALLLLAPRHKERFEEVAALLKHQDLAFTRRSSAGAVPADCAVLLVDTLGELVLLYAAADIAFVGGSLVPVGGHNLIEPAALGLPVLTGPYQANNRDIAAMLLQVGAAAQVADASELAAVLERLFLASGERQRMGAAAIRLVDANRGSVARLVALSDSLLAAAHPPTAH